MIARLVGKRLLRRIDGGTLTVVEDDRRHVFGPPDEALRVEVRFHDPRVWRTIVFRGSTGLGESYMDGRWDADDLTALVRLAARNAHKLDRLRRAFALLVRPVQAVRQWRSNTPRRSRRQIARHYDLGNDLFALMLDPTMVYSCGLFEPGVASLEQAQLAKLDGICAKLDLRPDDHLLEIGTGWGALAIHAASRYGCRVTTTTISREQHALASARVREAGLGDRVTVLLKDYRELSGTYDKLVSVEMIEAVGWRNFDRFFAKCSSLLEPDGVLALQAITIDERAYEVEKAGTSFITTFIFPGGALPSVEVMARSVRRRTDLQWLGLEDITPHYVTTLQHWRERFVAAREELDKLGYDERFRRLWELYLRYCEAGFAERRICCAQVVLAKPLAQSRGRRENIRPLKASRTAAGPREASFASASRPPGPTM